MRCRVVTPVAVDLPGDAPEPSPRRGAPRIQRRVRGREGVDGPEVRDGRRLAGRRVDAADLAIWLEPTHDLDPEVDLQRPARSLGVAIDEHVVPVRAELGSAAQQGPD